MEYKEIVKELHNFDKNRGWDKYHSLISLSRALGIESSEVEKIFLWKSSDKDLSKKDIDDLKMEIADVLIYTFYMCDKLNVSPKDIVKQKLDINKTRHWKFDK
ncbi:nucleotide pyrophosphohydrolase [Apilactobacillus timberlakei]|uniref:nucleotide pyrophosphohydrolase n=1 Tax=Apilactobacillus timberlakei TaxID=2008380 RepID=UPI00112A6188|nr:nucleotide pyrophosphohydrolase [Apilactobacillus timberlakei]TPR18967.1 nucleotide pyrophosphohydrolase [Apilactobacillus timberlakei]TPR20868.1 nucleotide pyrophosphohydrolase [Apilactobacillus timberlakei]TPR23519.1 nucleotide pyrophosphohydrolase [Apilactobacillus timberlakei]TPR24873.1 nucleotide pyrophosphohydrolase [Apilactobacillus timberlakei]